MRRGTWLALLALAAAPAAASGQALAERVRAVGSGEALLRFATRAGVEVCDRGFRLPGNGVRRTGGPGEEGRCGPGPAVVAIKVRAGRIAGVETLDRVGQRRAAGTDLGEVAPAQAVALLLAAAREGGGGDAVFPVLLADVEDAWRQVLALAEDERAPADARRSALFWVGQEAASAATAGLARVASDEGEDQEVRDAAVFALSQRPAGEGIPALLEVAATAREARTRRTAFFWLAQSGDPRAVAFFRRVLSRGG